MFLQTIAPIFSILTYALFDCFSNLVKVLMTLDQMKHMLHHILRST